MQLKGEIAVLNADEGITDLIALQFLVEKAPPLESNMLLKAFEPFAAGGEVEQVLGGPPLALKVGLLFRCGADLQLPPVVSTSRSSTATGSDTAADFVVPAAWAWPAQPLLPGDAVQGGGIAKGAGWFDFSHGIPSTPAVQPSQGRHQNQGQQRRHGDHRFPEQPGQAPARAVTPRIRPMRCRRPAASSNSAGLQPETVLAPLARASTARRDGDRQLPSAQTLQAAARLKQTGDGRDEAAISQVKAGSEAHARLYGGDRRPPAGFGCWFQDGGKVQALGVQPQLDVVVLA